MNKSLEWYVEWISTGILIIGVTLTAYNIYPLNVYLSLAGNFGWFVIAVMWRKWSLGVVQIILSAIYLAGLAKYFGLY
jgi:hypothetical protein